ncbi:double-strand break repair protein AddB [Rubricella aquisinus]|uniref:Double-strand break repair protein AddB n=1 Tax=Rubricella aquisinus TaxID=2028108 RepID=A0A840WFV4_9RHOB|nr:double-strand break repair protein AddB [Rubricella aquisinus]MBB5514039.1 double-strand break repair protein AddB [Rubricella aquisinus]
MFEPQDEPRVFFIPLGADFGAHFADGLAARLIHLAPEDRARVSVMLNTARALRRVQDRLAAARPALGLMPQMRTVTDLDAFHLPPAVDGLRRRLHIARLVAELQARTPTLAPRAAVFDLAASLADLLDELQEADIPAQALRDIDLGAFAAHWAVGAQFVEILAQHWPAALAALEDGALDPGARQRLSVEGQVAAWRAAPPHHPIIAAGSTGSRGPTRALLTEIATLPQGAIVLPGLDHDLPAAMWADLAEDDFADHPQHGLAKLLRGLGMTPSDVAPWSDRGAGPGARGRLLSLALRPAPVTDQWRLEGPAQRAELPAATEGVTLLTAATPREEAQAIALAMRGAIAAGQTVALVTPDRDLSRRVSTALGRWGVLPDDSAGRPLNLTPPGIFLRLVMDAMGQGPSPVGLLALLQHPLAGGDGEARKAHLAHLEVAARRYLPGLAAPVDWERLCALPLARLEPDEDSHAWLRQIEDTLRPLRLNGDAPLADYIAAHRAVAEAVSKGQGSTLPLWEKEAGAEARKLFDRLTAAADAAAPLTLSEYRALVAQELAGTPVRAEGYRPYRGVSILGTLEARTQSADLVILGGLNDGTWPSLPGPDPWVNRAMRKQIGLTPPERRVGLSAHDFQNAASAGQVILSRAAKVDGTPTVPSRWLNRLTNLIKGLGPEGTAAFDAMAARGAMLIAQAKQLETPDERTPRARRPAPRPPVGVRPPTLSVTQIETLIRDPYAIYARHVLRLRKRDPVGELPDARDRGMALHDIMEQFSTHLKAGWPEDAGARFDAIVQDVLTARAPTPALRLLWESRIAAAREEILKQEQILIETGRPIALECRGERRMTTPAFTLTAKADRIDLMEDGTLRILDYKASDPPSKKQIEVFNKQLPLEAAIAAGTGFRGVGGSDVRALHIKGLKYDVEKGQLPERSLAVDPETVQAVWAGLAKLIAAYDGDSSTWPARIRPQFIQYESDYDHLSRFGEWSDGDTVSPEAVGR